MRSPKIAVVVLSLGLFWNASVFSQGIKVTIKVTHSSDYCGGVDPGDEEIRRLATPVPLQGVTLFVRRGDYNNVKAKVVGTGKTDTTGTLVITLDTGAYVIVGKDKLNKKLHDATVKKYRHKSELHSPASLECLTSWLKSPLTRIKVEEKGTSLFTFNIHETCYFERPPCVQFYYNDPPP